MTYLNGANGGHDQARRRIAFAMVDLVGRHGFGVDGIEAVCERAQVKRSHFDRCFADLEDCFLSLHDEIAAEFWTAVEAAHRAADSWHDQVWAAGWAAMRFLQADPVRARFLLVAVNGSGGGALLRRDCIVQRFADLLDGGRGDARRLERVSRCTAEIAAGAVYSTLVAKVEAGAIERDEEFLPELIYMAVVPYLGAQAAEEELSVQPLH